MAVRNGSFEPPKSRYPGAGPRVKRWQQALVLTAALIVVGQAVYHLRGWAAVSGIETVQAAPAPAAQVSFVAQAAGTVIADVDLYGTPAGGTVLAHVAKGTPVVIGGSVNLPAGLWSRDVLWVRLGTGIGDTASGTFGFLAADSIAINGGTPLRLSLRGVPPEALLQPESGVRYAADTVANVSSGASATGAGVAAPGTGASSADVPVDFDIAWLPPSIDAWRSQIIAAAQGHGVDPALVAIVMLVESGGNPRAQSPSGAAGLMQVMPSTAAGIAQERAVSGYSPDQLWAPETNIDFGAYYIAQQLRSFGIASDTDWQQSVELAAAAYNGGPGSVQRLLAGGALPNESARYRQWVGGMWRERHQATSPTYTAWSQAGGAVLVAAAEQALASR